MGKEEEEEKRPAAAAEEDGHHHITGDRSRLNTMAAYALVATVGLIAAVCIRINSSDLQPVSAVDDQYRVSLLQVIFRHGDRTPTKTFPTDEHWDSWKEGYGQLTNVGKRQGFDLGRFVRSRYGRFLNTTYNPKEVLVRSSDKDRTLMTASCFLAGLFPPQSWQIWNNELPWQPIPIHTTPLKKDLLMKGSDSCARYDQALKETLQFPEMQELNEKYKDLLHTLRVHTGVNVTTVMKAASLADVFIVQEIHGMKLPEWVIPYMPQLREAKNIKFQWKTKTQELKRLQVGGLIEELRHNLHKKSHRSSSDKKLLVFSGHDSTIAGVLNSLGVFNGIAPPYVATVLIELLEDLFTNNYYVQVLYRNSTAEPLVMKLPNCSSPCPIDSFLTLTESVVLKDPKSECHVHSIL